MDSFKQFAAEKRILHLGGNLYISLYKIKYFFKIGRISGYLLEF
jgi:hypothetical protein